MSFDTSSQNTTLNRYGSTSTSEASATAGPGQPIPDSIEPLTLTNPPSRPDTDVPEWKHNRTEHGLSLKSFKGAGFVGGNGDLQVASHDGRWIVDGSVRKYIEAHGDRIWPIPETYTAFNEFPRYLARMDGALHRYGWGISADQLEKTLRLLTGGGRYDATEYTLYACCEKPYVLAGPEGAVLSKIGLVHRPDHEYNRPKEQIGVPGGQITVEEANEDILTGISRFAAILDTHFDRRLVSHTGSPRAAQGRHWFETASGDSVAVDAGELETLGQLATTPEDVSVYQGTEVDLPVGDHTAEVSWTDPSYQVGERNRGSPIVGYEFVWGRRPGLTYSAEIHTHWLYEAKNHGHFQYKMNHYTTRLKTVEV
ncbi:hypothetical protein [Halorussus sp. AFM4]|uniref:hypothetical protein n=1 Tax=Halorussus sp. AFM4 TaxID=3421651 RepID=UPI003EB69D0A